MALNIVVLQGRLTKDVDLRYTSTTQKPYAHFSIAVDRGNGNNETGFFNCTAWEKTATFVDQHFKKGDAILVMGKIQMRNYEDSHGNKRTDYSVIVNNVNFCGSKANTNSVAKPGFVEVDDGDDLPF